MISLGDTLSSGFENWDFLEFRKMLEASHSKKLCTELSDVQFRLWNLVVFGASGSESEPELSKESRRSTNSLLMKNTVTRKPKSF